MDLIEAAVVRLLREQPFYASLIMNLKRASAEEAKALTQTACVYARRDGTIGLAMNEDFCGKLKPKEQDAVLVHECLHVVNLHLLRGPEDMPQPDLANIAMDLAINQFIQGLPDGALTLDMFKELKLAKEETADYYYDRLRQKFDALKKKFGDAMPKALDDHGLFGKGEPAPGEGKGKSGAGKGVPGAGEPKGGGVPRILAEAAARAAIEEAVRNTKAGGGWGTVPAGIQRMVDRALASKVDWRAALRRFVGERIRVSTTSTRKRPNRRFRWDYAGKKVVRGARLLVAIDTSGSIGERELSQFLAEIEAIAERAEIVVAEVDAAVNALYRFSPKRTKPTFKGGGGTSFQVVWDALAARKHKELRTQPDGVIYLTDGEAPWPRSDGGFPTLWVFTQESKVAQKPFGQAVFLPIGEPT